MRSTSHRLVYLAVPASDRLQVRGNVPAVSKLGKLIRLDFGLRAFAVSGFLYLINLLSRRFNCSIPAALTPNKAPDL